MRMRQETTSHAAMTMSHDDDQNGRLGIDVRVGKEERDRSRRAQAQ
jgi:hypothetical protein